MDPIERQAAIDMLDKYLRMTDVPISYPGIISALTKRLNELPPAPPEQRWISVSERLPKEKDAGILKKLGIEKRSEYVLATVEVKGERITAIVCTLDGKWHWKMRYAFPDFKVVAWMTMPEAYEEEKK